MSRAVFLNLVVFGILSTSAPAWGQSMAGSVSTKAAIRRAVDDGYSEYWASTSVQQEINSKLGRPADAGIKIKLKRLQVFNPECARLAVIFAEPAGTALFELQMNICKDGTPPLEGVNLATPLGAANSTPVPRPVQ